MSKFLSTEYSDKKLAKTDGAYGFIISKPLPLMVSLAIIDQLPTEVVKELIIIDTFFGAEKLASKLIEASTIWRHAIFLKNHVEAFKYCRKRRYEKLFIDSDVGFQKNIDLIKLKICSRNTKVSVYEEGLGSYRNEIYHGIRKKILPMLGCSIYFGNNWLTKEIYLFEPDYYHKNVPHTKVKAQEIKTKLSQFLKNYEREFDNLFDIKELRSNLLIAQSKRSCTIYLSAWYWDAEKMKRPDECNNYRIVKFHPHVKNPPATVDVDFDLTVSPGIPAEILLLIASKIFDRVHVLHHGSSVERYINFKNIEFEKIPDDNQYASTKW